VGVFVVGMHRSGTSAVAAALEALGLDAGAPEYMMAADAGNPAGYFELQEIGDLNDEILASVGGGWDCPPQLVDGWELEPTMTPEFRRAATIVGTRLAKNSWLIKDPRITLLLPLWRRAVLDRCVAVLIVRDPMEVAWSLALRNGMPILTGLALWSEYNRRALAGLSGLPVHVCSYDELVADPLSTMTAIGESLASWSELPADADIEAAAARIRPELRRNTWPRDNADMIEVPGETERLVKFMNELTGPHRVFEPGTPPTAAWEQALLEERRTGVVRLRISEAETDAAIQARDQMIYERDGATRERDSLGHQLHARNLEFDVETESVRTERARADQIGHDLAAVRVRIGEVHADLDDVQARRRAAEKALRESERKVKTLENSRPIRIARLFKRLGRLRSGRS
jgi:hypothetical protein